MSNIKVKNLTETNKRIRLIPKNAGAVTQGELDASIVENNSGLGFCLSPFIEEPDPYRYFIEYDTFSPIDSNDETQVSYRINGLDIAPGDAIYSALRERGLIVSETTYIADPYDPYGGSSKQRMLNITKDEIVVEITPTDAATVAEFNALTGVSGQVTVNETTIKIILAPYEAELTALVDLAKNARAFGWTAVGANDPSVKFTVKYKDKYTDEISEIGKDFLFNGVPCVYVPNGEYDLPHREEYLNYGDEGVDFNPQIHVDGEALWSNFTVRIIPYVPLEPFTVTVDGGASYTLEYTGTADEGREWLLGSYTTTISGHGTDLYLTFPEAFADNYFGSDGVSPTLIRNYENQRPWVDVSRGIHRVSHRNIWPGSNASGYLAIILTP